MEKFVAIDMSRAYLSVRMKHESSMVLDDEWLSKERRFEAGTLYVEAQCDFNRFFKNLEAISRVEMAYTSPDEMNIFIDKTKTEWYFACVNALEVYRDNLDAIYCMAYGDKHYKLQRLSY